MSETADYIEETEDYTVRGGEVPEDGDDIAGEEGELVIEIIQANYPAGKTATAQDADLTAANVKSGANIFGVVGEHAPLTGDDVAGGEGALLIAIPAANYPAGKKTTAQDADLIAGNIKDGVTIFGVEGTLDVTEKDSFTGAEGLKVIPVPAGLYPAGKTATAQDADLTAANIKEDVIIFGVTGTLEGAAGREMVFGPKVPLDDLFISGASPPTTGANYLSIGNHSGNVRDSSIRMPKVSIVPGSTITEAFLRITANLTQSGNDCNVKVHFNTVDDAVAPTTNLQFQALSLDAGVAWAAIGAWVANTEYDSPSIKDLLQAIIDRVGWTEDNAVQAVMKDNGSSLNARRSPGAIEWDYGQKRVELHVKWTE